MPLLGQAKPEVEVKLEVLPEAKQFVVTVTNKSERQITLTEFGGKKILELKIELWSFERGVSTRPKSIQEVSDLGGFVVTKGRDLKPSEKLVVTYDWGDLTAAFEENKKFLDDLFSSEIHIFDERGRLVDWTFDRGDDARFVQRWGQMNEGKPVTVAEAARWMGVE